jgi:hypothetical protein
MGRNKARKTACRSTIEFQRRFFPKSFKKKMAEKPTDAQALGATLAKETLEKVEGKLAEIDSA